MNQEFPANSNKAKRVSKKDISEKKVEKVIEGEVVQQKKPFGRKMKEIFFAGDSESVWDYVLSDVFIPAAKDTISDAISGALERILWGEERSRNRRRHPNRDDRYTDYQSRYRYGYSPARREPSRPPWDQDRRSSPRRSRSSNSLNEIILQTRVEAEDVIEGLFELVEKYDLATVADLYDLLGIQSTDARNSMHTDNKWGWLDVRDFDVRRIREGYLLVVPKPEALD